MFRIYPYKPGSASVRLLKSELGAKIIKLTNSRYRPRPEHVVINWGNSHNPSWLSSATVLNKPDAVATASNKLSCFVKLKEQSVPTVPFTTSIDEATEWLEQGSKVFTRLTLNGHSGEGIQVVEPPANDNQFLDEIASRLWERGYEYLSEQVMDEQRSFNGLLSSAPLYTRAVTNHGEYRVHVFNGEVILYQKKSRRREGEEVDAPDESESLVRNLASTWVYRTGSLRRLERVEQLAIDAVRSLGLDFGAVDIIKDEQGNVYVLEVNTAPGISNTETRAAYINAFNNI